MTSGFPTVPMPPDFQPASLDQAYLLTLARTRMPFGKYKGTLLIDLPEPYVVWFSRKGFPGGKLGEMLRITYEIKANGLEYLFDPLRPAGSKRPR